MDLIKKFMKIGGFKTPYELEAYGEDRFFNDFPEARQYARGGHIKAQDGLWFQDPNKQALYDAETRYLEANQRGPNNNPDAAKAYGDILAMDPSATDIRQKVDSLNNVYPYYSSSFQVVPFKGGYGKYGNRTNQGWEATQELYNKEKQKPSIIPMDFSEPKWKGTVKKAYGGMPEAYPQIATFDKAFSYGVPPGPQYLAHGGSAYPQAQTEQQFFIPIYTDVYNPYNKAMGGSNVEMYPNAKTTPHWGPTNIFFQEGGQEGAPQDGQDLDRLGTLNKTGAFVNNLKQTAAKANAKNAMMSAINNVGMAKYGKQLSKYDPGGATAVNSASTSNNYKINPVTGITPYISQQMSPTSSQFNPTPYFGVDPPSYDQQLLNNMRARGIVYNPNQGQAYYNPYQAQGYNPYATGDMSNFLPSVYDWNNMNQFMFQTKGSPRYKWKTNVPGEGKKRGVSNMDFLNAIFPELYGDTDAQMKALNDPKYADRRKQWGISEITNTPKGLFGKRRQTSIKFGDFAGTSTDADADAGPSKTPMDMTRKNQPGPVATQSDDPIPFTLDDANTQLQQNNPRAKSIMDNLQDVLTAKPGQKSAPAVPSAATPPGTQPNQTGTLPAMLQNNPAYQATPPPNSFSYTVPGTAAQASSSPSYPFPVASSSQRVSQAPSNANSMDAATAQKKAGEMDPSRYVNQDYIDAQRAAASGQAPAQEYLTGAPYRTQVGPPAEPSAIDFSEPANPYASVMAGNAPITMTAQPDPNAYLTGAPYRTPAGPMVGPEGFAYGGYTGYRYGGSYKQGDVVYMSDDEIAEFIRNGGQIEEME